MIGILLKFEREVIPYWFQYAWNCIVNFLFELFYLKKECWNILRMKIIKWYSGEIGERFKIFVDFLTQKILNKSLVNWLLMKD